MTLPPGQVMRFHGPQKHVRVAQALAEFGSCCEVIDDGAVRFTVATELRLVTAADEAIGEAR